MFRILCMAFALCVAFAAATIINGATESAKETFETSFHHAAASTR